jgi:hypothetical protein
MFIDKYMWREKNVSVSATTTKETTYKKTVLIQRKTDLTPTNTKENHQSRRRTKSKLVPINQQRIKC